MGMATKMAKFLRLITHSDERGGSRAPGSAGEDSQRRIECAVANLSAMGDIVRSRRSLRYTIGMARKRALVVDNSKSAPAHHVEPHARGSCDIEDDMARIARAGH